MSYFFENIVYSFWPGEIPSKLILYYPRSVNLFEAAHFHNIPDLKNKSCNNLILLLNRKEELVLIPSVLYKNLVVVLPPLYNNQLCVPPPIGENGYTLVRGLYGLKFWEPYVSGTFESIGDFIRESYSIMFCKDTYEFI